MTTQPVSHPVLTFFIKTDRLKLFPKSINPKCLEIFLKATKENVTSADQDFVQVRYDGEKNEIVKQLRNEKRDPTHIKIERV